MPRTSIARTPVTLRPGVEPQAFVQADEASSWPPSPPGLWVSGWRGLAGNFFGHGLRCLRGGHGQAHFLGECFRRLKDDLGVVDAFEGAAVGVPSWSRESGCNHQL